MSHSRLNSRRIREKTLESAVVRQWRANLNTLVDQLADGWALLVEDTGRAIHPPVHPLDRAASRDAAPRDASAWPAESEAGSPEPLDQSLRRYAGQAGICQAPAGFSVRVRMRLPLDPPPYQIVSLNPYAHLREHVRLVFGTLSFSALLLFSTSWLMAVAEPSLAFAALAALVTLVILVAESLRLAWQTAAGAASNPLVALVAMAGPLVAFAVVALHTSRWSDHPLREA